ncbi:transglycosylase SLT domain-containing protein [Roseobacter ponti]
MALSGLRQRTVSCRFAATLAPRLAPARRAAQYRAMIRRAFLRYSSAACLALMTAGAVPAGATGSDARALPQMRWHHTDNSALWNAAALDALRTHGRELVEMVPADIGEWCPLYPIADTAGREAFWVGFMSALAKHESTWRPRAVGGEGRWYGLLQISPATARGYGCRAGTGEALKRGGENLSCAVRIMASTVPRDGVIDHRDTRWRGVAADWGPLRVPRKRNEMAAWTRAQPFCLAPLIPAKRPGRTPVIPEPVSR